MGQAIRAALDAYRKTRHEQKEKSRLIRKDIDYILFQKMLNALADNQEKLGIDIHLSNGTIIKLKKEKTMVTPLRDPYNTEVIQ